MEGFSYGVKEWGLCRDPVCLEICIDKELINVLIIMTKIDCVILPEYIMQR